VLLDSMFVWLFHGAYFNRHFHVDPEQVLLTSRPMNAAAAGDKQFGSPSRASMWGILRDAKRMHVTPCGGHKQAVDEVIVDVVQLCDGSFAGARCVVVTSDNDLARAVQEMSNARTCFVERSLRTDVEGLVRQLERAVMNNVTQPEGPK